MLNIFAQKKLHNEAHFQDVIIILSCLNDFKNSLNNCVAPMFKYLCPFRVRRINPIPNIGIVHIGNGPVVTNAGAIICMIGEIKSIPPDK